MNIRINMPKKVSLIINELKKNGYEAYAVGGCVRDSILGKEPNDWDITTSAKPERVKEIFHKTIDTGIEHGTVTVMISGEGFEVTTYRVDGEYKDGRHPEDVVFTGNLIEDLKRRDFTINAMAYNNEDGLVDAFDGVGDIEKKVIRCVGNPIDRFNEDALRILRAIRFAGGLDFEVEEKTRLAVEALAENLEKISRERIQAELEKLFMSNHPEKILMAYETGVTKVIMPEFDSLMRKKQGEFFEGELIVKLMRSVPAEHHLRWTALLCRCSEKEAIDVLKGLKFDNDTVKTVSKLVGVEHMEALSDDIVLVRKAMNKIGVELYPLYLKFIKYYAEFFDDVYSEQVLATEKNYDMIVANGDCVTLKDLKINGRDVMEQGVERGNAVGEVLQKMLEKVMEKPELNTRETLMTMVQEISGEACIGK